MGNKRQVAFTNLDPGHYQFVVTSKYYNGDYDDMNSRKNKHTIGTESSEDVLVYEEKDETFGCSVYKTKSKDYLIISSYQTMSTEYRFLDANNPGGEWKVIQNREEGLEYSVDHFGNDFYIVTNHEAKNFRLMKTPVTKTTKDNKYIKSLN